MKTTLFLDRITFYAYHGVGEQETKVGNEFRVSVTAQFDFTQAVESDKLDGTISYADIYELVKIEMQTPSKLIEHVAGRIHQSIFKNYPQIESLSVTVEKLTPPMGAQVKACGVTIST